MRTLLSLSIFLAFFWSSCSNPNQIAGIFDFSKYKDLRVQTVLELVVEKGNGYSDIMIENQQYPLKAYLMHNEEWVAIDIHRASEEAGQVPSISSAEIGEPIELIARLPKEYSSDSVLLYFQLDIANLRTGVTLQGTDVARTLENVSVATAGIDASSNPPVILSVATSLAVAMVKSDDNKIVITKERVSELKTLADVLRDYQKTLQDSIKRDETFEATDYVETLFARISDAMQTNTTIRTSITTSLERITDQPGKAEQVIATVVSTYKPVEENTKSVKSIFVEPGTTSPSTSTQAPADTTPPSAPVLTAQTPTRTPSWSWSAVTDAVKYRYKLDSDDFSSGSTETTSLSHTPTGVLSDGPHTLYLQAADLAGNWSSTGSLALTVDRTADIPTLAGYPTGNSVVTVLDVTVSSVTSYKYKLGLSSSIDCNQTAGYSSAIAVSTKITDDLSGLADAALTLCVLGLDTAGNESIVSVGWTKRPQLAPTAPVVASKPTGTTYIFPRADDTGAGATVLDNKLYFLVTASDGTYMGRATISGSMDATFGTSGWVKLSTLSNPDSITTSGATLVACNSRLFGYSSKKIYEYNFTTNPQTLTQRYDLSVSEGNGADGAPIVCLEDRYVIVSVINNSNDTNAFVIYDSSTDTVLADKVISPGLGQYPFPIRETNSNTWYLHYGSNMRALDSNFEATGATYTLPTNVAGTSHWYLRSATYGNGGVTLMMYKNATVRGIFVTTNEMIARFVNSTWGTLPTSNFADYTVQNLYTGATSISELYGCYAGGKYFFMTYSTVGYSTGAFTFAFGLHGSTGTLSSAFNSGSELVLTTDPYNYYTARYYTSISCKGNTVFFLRPSGAPYSSTSIIANWIDASL